MRNKLFLALNVTVAASTGFSASPAIAYEAGDMILRAGAAHVDPNDDSSVLDVPALGGKLAGTGAEVDAGTALGITFTYMLNSHWGIELLAATPFEHDIEANLGGGTRVDAGSAKHLPPTLSLQWYPNQANAEFQPYVGVGINHTLFFEEDVDSDLETALSVTGGSLELDSSWGASLQAGFDYSLNEDWVINAAIWYIDIETDATFKFDGGVTADAEVEIDPMVYMLSLGYKF
jgi:outer membrane protein